MEVTNTSQNNNNSNPEGLQQQPTISSTFVGPNPTVNNLNTGNGSNNYNQVINASHEDIVQIKNSLKKITDCIFTILKHSKQVDKQIRQMSKVQTDHNISSCQVYDYYQTPKVTQEVQVPICDHKESFQDHTKQTSKNMSDPQDLDPDGMTKIPIGNPKDLITLSNDMIFMQNSFRTEITDFLKKEGNDHFNSGRYTKAIELYSKALDTIDLVDEGEVIEERTPAILCTNMGICYQKLQEQEEAYEKFGDAASQDPSYEKGMNWFDKCAKELFEDEVIN